MPAIWLPFGEHGRCGFVWRPASVRHAAPAFPDDRRVIQVETPHKTLDAEAVANTTKDEQ